MKRLFLLSVLFGLFVFTSCKKEQEVSDKFYSYVQNGQYEDAYSLCTDEFKDAASLEDVKYHYQGYNDEYGDLKSFKVTGFNTKTNNGKKRTVLDYKLKYEDGTVIEHVYLVNEGGSPAIQYIEFDY